MFTKQIRAELAREIPPAIKELLNSYGDARKVARYSKTRALSRFSSQKSGQMIRCESLNEKAAFTILEADPKVWDYRAQPARFELQVDGKKRKCFPDILHVDWMGQLTLTEVKLADKAENPDDKARWEAVEQECNSRGMKFQIWTEKKFKSQPLLSNSQTVLFNRLHIPEYGTRFQIKLCLMNGPASASDLAPRFGLTPGEMLIKLQALAGWAQIDVNLDNAVIDSNTPFSLFPDRPSP